jgi:hypothetical protein
VDLDSEASVERLQVIFRPNYRLVQDEQSPGDSVQVHLKRATPVRSFRYDEGKQGFVGELLKSQTSKLQIESDPYDVMRTGKLTIEFSTIEEAANNGAD